MDNWINEVPDTEDLTEDLPVDCGDASLDFQMGNFMNALNELACYFEGKRGEEMENLVAAMRFYCDLQERYFEDHHK